MDTIEIVFDLLIIVALNMTTNQPEKCLTCKDSLTRVPRTPLQRLLPGSARYYCSTCHKHFFKFLGI